MRFGRAEALRRVVNLNGPGAEADFPGGNFSSLISPGSASGSPSDSSNTPAALGPGPVGVNGKMPVGGPGESGNGNVMMQQNLNLTGPRAAQPASEGHDLEITAGQLGYHHHDHGEIQVASAQQPGPLPVTVPVSEAGRDSDRGRGGRGTGRLGGDVTRGDVTRGDVTVTVSESADMCFVPMAHPPADALVRGLRATARHPPQHATGSPGPGPAGSDDQGDRSSDSLLGELAASGGDEHCRSPARGVTVSQQPLGFAGGPGHGSSSPARADLMAAQGASGAAGPSLRPARRISGGHNEVHGWPASSPVDPRWLGPSSASGNLFLPAGGTLRF